MERSVCGFLLFLVAPLLAGCPERPLTPRGPSPGATHFTIQTFNVEISDDADPETIAAVGASDADVLCLQEVTPRWQATLVERYGARYPYAAWHVERGQSTSGLGVLSRFPVTDLGIDPAPAGAHPAWHLHVETPAGPVQVLQAHLRAPLNGARTALEAYLTVDGDHREAVDVFTARLREGLPTIVLGDFNEDDEGAAVKRLEAQGFVNALPLFHPGQPTWRYRSVAGQMDRALDHIMYGPGLAPLNAYVLRAGRSDHLPVVAHFEIERTAE
jgi:endonuclease/exonuclease/phosphatase family metal-dependent hydrolase